MNESSSSSSSSKLKSSPRNDSTLASFSPLECGLFDGDPQSFLSEGNKHFIYKRFTAAIADYTEGLTRCKTEVEADQPRYDSVENAPRKRESEKEKGKESNKSSSSSSVFLELLSNRALAYLSIENYEAALQDTQKIIAICNTHLKGKVRHAKALAGLRRYEQAIDFLNNSVQQLLAQGDQIKSQDLRELTSFVERLKRMKHQSETGDFYNVPQIMDKPYEPSPPDWVDYIGPVKVVNVQGKGRGLVAAQDLPPGKLICACRAFEILFLGEQNTPAEGLSEESMDALTEGHFKVEDDLTLNLLARKIYDRLTRNPEKRTEFYQLHAGNDLGHLEPPTGSDATAVHPLDMARIYGICRTNTFANSGDSYPEVEKSVGLWVFPAYVNHQCIGGNCTWKIFSDFLFIRTYRQVKKGEELLVSYVSPAYPFKARTEVLTKRLGFICSCTLCELDRSLPQSTHDDKDRLKLLVQNQEVKFAQLDPSEGSHSDYAKKVDASILLLEQIISKLEKIQPKHGMYNASLLDPLQKLGLKYFGVGEFKKMTKVMERACSLMKCCMLPHGVVDCSMWIVAAYLQMGNFKLAKKWGKVLKDNCILAYGDILVLKVLGAWILDPMTKWGLLS